MSNRLNSQCKKNPAVLSWVASLLVLGLYAAGLLSPLTPSYGKPGIGALLVFWILPMVLLTAPMLRARSPAVRIAFGVLVGLVFFSYLRIAVPIWLAR